MNDNSREFFGIVGFVLMIGGIVMALIFTLASMIDNHNNLQNIARDVKYQTEFMVRTECAWERDQVSPPNADTVFQPVADCR